ncbi:MAG: hypothetical protein A2735_00635 [Candidatus Yanofskybacteria bacterium RIFCSPHIGHO2_01_FULL_41_21]|uniref:UDP-4-amino-4, 6-dideoxy-N-acetyl-beta-L-altrosamine transaminase n=1 Tax=Candidatus Yanofskybacteria bacterium RIFCSPHIGHO2_01_FULL_41_21 TaxID=1802660 RepID=A0A1F8EBT2_9BACT|nr:MAG: hypothetical protein A2735_00635 [Candidatus Yanofskybacteria bacterium RIFCSPHIGHO2_01_FULL_41_21]
MKIQFLSPNLNKKDIQEAVKVLKSGWITYGPVTEKFEEIFAGYVGSKKAVFNSSGTAALHVALLVAGVGPGDEVITTPLSYVATSNVILYVGATPVFVDVDAKMGLIDLNKIKGAITSKTKAVIPVHLYGQMVDMKKLKKICGAKIKIIEDSAHAIESERDGIKPGQLSFASCFSFHAAKNITSGEGGAVTVNDDKLAHELKLLCEGGVERTSTGRFMTLLGYKYSATTFQAAMLISQMKRINSDWKKRKILWERYKKGLTGVAGVSFPEQVPNSRHGYNMFVIWVEPTRRDILREKLGQAGIQTSIHFNPIHLEPHYKKSFGYKKGDFPVTEKLGFSSITLPLHQKLTKENQDYIVDKIKELLEV